MSQRGLTAPRSPELYAFVTSFILFALMAAPGVTWMDSGELTAAAYTLGGAHPPGHPAHTLLGKLATLLPFGEIAFRVSLLSAVTMAAAVAGVVALSRALLATELVAACVAAALVTLSPVTQLNATRAEVYAPVAALLVWAMAATVRFARAAAADDADADGRLVLAAAGACGLAAAFHPVIAAVTAVPMIVTLAWHARHRLTRLAPAAVGLGLLGLFCYAYLPLRANAAHPPTLMWGEPAAPAALYKLLTGSAYQGNFAVAGAPARFAELMLLVGEGMGLTILFGGLLGLMFATLSGLRAAGVIAASAFLVVAGASTQRYFNPDMPGYVLPALMMLAVGLVPLTGAVIRMLPRDENEPRAARWHHGVAALVLLPLVAIGLLGHVVRAEDGGFRRNDDATRWFSQTVDQLPPGPALYFADGDPTLFAAQYEHFVAGGRPDVAIANHELLRDRWFLDQVRRQRPELDSRGLDDKRGHVAERLARRNVARFPVAGDDFTIAGLLGRPLGRAYQYSTTPPATLPPAPPPLQFSGYVGRRVAGRIALTRTHFELSAQRFDQAVVAAGLDDRFAADAEQLKRATASPRRPPLLVAVERASPPRDNLFLFEPWQLQLAGDEIAWRAGLKATPAKLPATAPFERRLHRAYTALLSRRATLAGLPIARDSLRAAKQTALLLLRTGMAFCQGHDTASAAALWQQAYKLEPGRKPAAAVLQQLGRCNAGN